MVSGKGKEELALLFKEDFEYFIELLYKRLELPLPGVDSHLKLAPVHRIREIQQEPPKDAIQSSVLLLLYPIGNKFYTHVILRSEYDGIHSGQISFPGGRREETDRNHVETALREAQEETGIDTSKVQVLGSLTRLYIDRSNYVVFPYIGYVSVRPEFKPDPVEVQEIVEFEIAEVFEPGALLHKTLYLSNGFSLKAPGFMIGGHFMWGATAMIFSEFIDIVRSLPEMAKQFR
jgi:8-oxo-dGTP pyrophosphatase MutT (NUDIX family)